MNNMWRMAAVALGLLGLAAILGGCQGFLPLEELGVDSEQTVSGLGVNKEGVDYTCVDRAADIATPPPPIPRFEREPGEDLRELPTLCPPGKVPQSIVKFDGPPKRLPPEIVPLAVTCDYGACYDWGTSKRHILTLGINRLPHATQPGDRPI